MKDRVNYRFWDKKEKVMLDWDCICQTAFNCYIRKEGNKMQRYGLMYCAFTTHSKFIPLQCTGLKDNNGKLIYEGDMVKEYNDIGEFERIKDVRLMQDVMIGFNLNSSYGYEVIGNIYENPELLKEVQSV